jgi:quercetin dioxygenase-like cupin family protein
MRAQPIVGPILLLAAAAFCPAAGIPLEKLTLDAGQTVAVRPVMRNQIREVTLDLVSLAPSATHSEPAHATQAVVWLVLEGKGTLRARNQSYAISGETIARAPQGWPWRIEAAPDQPLHLLRVKRDLTPADLEDMRKYPELQAVPWVKSFLDCLPYKEAIKSPKTTSRTLLPENHVARMALGTVETTGPDEVGAHSHPMLEQLFLGLRGNDITVTADASQANLTGFDILHIPLGSHHGARVAAGRKLHYVWMDFFMDKSGQEWLKMHKPMDEKKPQ